MKSAVLDTSAVLALFRDEEGADEVRRWLAGSYISSVNVAEILTVGRRRGSNPEAEQWAINQLNLNCVPFDNVQASLVASIVDATSGGNVGLADRACMALAIFLNMPVVTGDREWLEYDLNIEIKLFRR